MEYRVKSRKVEFLELYKSYTNKLILEIPKETTFQGVCMDMTKKKVEKQRNK